MYMYIACCYALNKGGHYPLEDTVEVYYYFIPPPHTKPLFLERGGNFIIKMSMKEFAIFFALIIFVVELEVFDFVGFASSYAHLLSPSD